MVIANVVHEGSTPVTATIISVLSHLSNRIPCQNIQGLKSLLLRPGSQCGLLNRMNIFKPYSSNAAYMHRET